VQRSNVWRTSRQRGLDGSVKGRKAFNALRKLAMMALLRFRIFENGKQQSFGVWAFNVA
jgi:hypothetical protein